MDDKTIILIAVKDNALKRALPYIEDESLEEEIQNAINCVDPDSYDMTMLREALFPELKKKLAGIIYSTCNCEVCWTLRKYYLDWNKI